MAEQFKSISEARKDLPTLAQTVGGGSDHVVITNQGKPQAVLVGYDDFRGLLAAVELINRPRELAQLREGLADTQRVSFADLRKTFAALKSEANPIEEPAAAPAPVRGETIDWMRRLSALKHRIDEALKNSFDDLFDQAEITAAVAAAHGVTPARSRLSRKEAAAARRERLLDEQEVSALARGLHGGRARVASSAGLATGRRSRTASGE